MRSMIVVAAAAAALAATMFVAPATASDQTDVMAVVKDYNAALNNGDDKAAALDCADQLYIIDEFAPYSWQGAGALSGWFNDYGAWTKQNAVTNDTVALSKPWRVDIEGERAYVVVPATFHYLKAGAPVVESGSVWTFALQRTAAGWRIVAWSWSKH